MLSEDQRGASARALFEAERDGAWIDPITATFPEVDIDDAYRISMDVTKLKLGAGRRIVGHKIGLTSVAMRDLVGADEPDYGTLFDDWFVPESATIPFQRLNHARVEIELAFVLASPLHLPNPTAADVIHATDFVLPALEIVDSRYRSRGSVVDSIADAATCGLVVLGSSPRRLTDIDIRNIVGCLEVNGEIVERGTSSASMGSPVNAVAWLAAKLHAFDVGLEAGQVILSGSFIRAPWISAGDELVGHFDDCGSVAVTIGQATT